MQGESLEGALRSLQRGDHAELLKRCATVRSFDAALFDVLRSHPSPVDLTLEQFVQARAIDAVPGRDGAYRLSRTDRREYLATWWSGEPPEVVPEPLLELSRRVLAHLEVREGNDVEALYHWLLVDPAAGLERVAAAFAHADEACDIARCQDLLDLLEERLPLLGPEGAEVHARLQVRLRSRALWERDWRRSARFVLPAPAAHVVDELLADGGPRNLAVHGVGGIGKSSLLHWLIARRCVPAGHACARIDFDHIDPLMACQEPWLLLLEAAHQLNEQLRDSPFHELLAQWSGQRERLRRIGPVKASPAERAGADVAERFGAVLAELGVRQPVVIALDTLELALATGSRRESDVVRVLELLSGLQRATPVLRIVLSGRYDLRERLRDFDERLPGTRSLRLEGLSADDARRYLSQYRGIARGDRGERIVAAAGGVPFKLALLADVADERPDDDPSAFDADLTYVMDRIVSRLDPELRAFVVCGAGPRTLEYGFAIEVIAPLLGTGVDAAEACWRALKRYGSSTSWVAPDRTGTDTLRIDPSVLRPLRRLLADGGQHDELHRRAAEWFEQRADADPVNATRWLCEAVYHRFQLEGQRAQAFWESKLHDARVERRPDRRRALAAEVLGEEYTRPGRDGTPLLAPRAAVRARWELAVAALQLGVLDRRLLPEGQRALEDLEHTQRAVGGQPLSHGEVALLRAGISLADGDLEAARPDIEVALRGRLAREDQLWLRLAFAGELSARGAPEATLNFAKALRIAERSPSRDADIAEVRLRLALHHADRDRLDRALAACTVGASGPRAVESALVRARVYRLWGRTAAALDALSEPSRAGPDLESRLAIERTLALLAARRPLDALAVAKPGGGVGRQPAVAAAGREVRGEVRARLLDAEAAIADLDEAATRWSELGDTDAVCRCWVRVAALCLHDLGDLDEAEVRLDQARRAPVARGQDAWTRRALLGAELLHRRGNSERAARLVADALDALAGANGPPRASIAAALQGLAATGCGATEPLLEQLCTQLSSVTPPTARLALLDGIARCPPLSESPALRARLRRLVPSPIRAGAAYADFAPRDLALLSVHDADLDRICGHADRARVTLEQAWRTLAPGASITTVRALIGASTRAGASALVEQLARHELKAIDPERTAAPVLVGAALIEAATALSDRGLRARVLERASELLAEPGLAAEAWRARLV